MVKTTRDAVSIEQKNTGSGTSTPARMGATSDSATPCFFACHLRAALTAVNPELIVSPVIVSYNNQFKKI